MRLQKKLEFLKKRDASMMFFLFLDVTMHLRNLRLAHRERTISVLPRKSACLFERSRNPTRRIRFQLADEFRDSLVLPQFCQEVNMIGSSVDDQCDSFFIVDGAAEILMNAGTDCGRQPWLSRALASGFNVLAPKARRITARGAAQQTPGLGCTMFLNPCQGVTENGFASNAKSREAN
jgi:hypothetical protein